MAAVKWARIKETWYDSAPPDYLVPLFLTPVPTAPRLQQNPRRRVDHQHRHKTNNDRGKYVGDHRGVLLHRSCRYEKNYRGFLSLWQDEIMVYAKDIVN
jgi:hypothetical protein